MTSNSFLKFALLGTVLALTACGDSTQNMDHSKMDHAEQQSGKRTAAVQISAARVAPPFEGRSTSAGYFTLENKGADTRLTHVTSPISDKVEIHNHIEEDGIMKMRRVEGVDLIKGKPVEFRPGSYHLMMFDTVLADDATDAALSLHFDNGETVSVIAEIEGRDGGMDHSGH